MQYDVVIIGGGPGGYVAAIKAAQLGGRVLLAEKDTLGGVCLNRGCIPTKTLLKCSGMYKSLKKAEQYGILIVEPAFDFSKMMDRKQQVVSNLVKGINGLMKSNGIDVVRGLGQIIDRNHVQIDNKVFETKNIIIATGSRPFKPNIKGIDSPAVMDSDALLSMEAVPESMVIIGGGVIGIEFAILLEELGCKVTILEMMDNILNMADEEIIKECRGILKANRIEVVTSARVVEIDGGSVTYEKEGGRKTVTGEKILVSTGRVPNTDQTELDTLGIRHRRGFIETDDRLHTSIAGIYAIGDVNGKYMLAHVASEEGITAVETIFGHEAEISYQNIPQCIYSHPEIAWVGLTEKEAREMGYDVATGKFPLSANGKSQADGDTTGFIKLVTDKKYGEILGAHMVCAHATDMISECTLALRLESTAADLASMMHPHPTVSEALSEAALKSIGKALHI
jgi:dihydrolipoamide dehydrogenase